MANATKHTDTVLQKAAADSKPKAAWVPIKTGAGRIVGYIEVFWGGKLGYVTVPGASRFRAA